MKSGNLNFLEPSGTLRACNGTALPFILSEFDRIPVIVQVQTVDWLIDWLIDLVTMCLILYNKFSVMIGEIVIGRLRNTDNKQRDKIKPNTNKKRGQEVIKTHVVCVMLIIPVMKHPDSKWHST